MIAFGYFIENSYLLSKPHADTAHVIVAGCCVMYIANAPKWQMIGIVRVNLCICSLPTNPCYFIPPLRFLFPDQLKGALKIIPGKPD